MARKQYQLRDLKDFFAAFRKESDRACAVLGRALLEDHVRRLLAAALVAETNLRDLFEGQAPLATFSSRIRLAEALGLLAQDEAADLNIVRDIGNDFAHGLDHSMSFDEQSIRDRVLALQSPRILLEYGHLTEPKLPSHEVEDFQKNPRRRFEITVGTLWSTLSRRAEVTKPPTRLKSLLTLLKEQTELDAPSA
jgi:hypothetical protein